MPADLLETLLITTEQALWGREWAARDGNLSCAGKRYSPPC